MPFEEIAKEPPHRVADGFLDKIRRFASDASENVAGMFDKLPLGGKGPHRGIKDIADGVGDAVGVAGEGVQTALDKPAAVVKEKGPSF